jgi:hypothetical protein
MAVSRLVIENTGIKEIDLNPVLIFDGGLMALDVGIVGRVLSVTDCK